MQIQDLKPGRTLQINVSRDGYSHNLISTIEAVIDKTVYVSLIRGRTGVVFKMSERDKIDIIYRIDDRLWYWKNVSGGIELLEGDRVHALTVAEEDAQSYNRRDSYRVFVGQEVELYRTVLDLAKVKEYRLNHPEITDINELVDVEECYSTIRIPAIIKDISENGVGLYSLEKIPEDAEIAFELPTSSGIIDCECALVRSSVEVGGKYRYFYGCRIISVSNNIMKILFELQRMQLSIQKRES